MPIWKNKEKAGVCAPYAHTPASGPLVALLATAALLVLGLGRLLGGLLRGLLVDGRGGRRRLGRLGQRVGAPLGPRLPALVALTLPALEVAGRQRGHHGARARRRAGHDGLRRDRPGPHLLGRQLEVPIEHLQLVLEAGHERHPVERPHTRETLVAGDEPAELVNRRQLRRRQSELLLDVADAQDETVPRRHLALVHEAPKGALRDGADVRAELRQTDLHHRGHSATS